MRHSRTRGQSSIEFLVLTSAMVVGLGIMVIVAQGLLTSAIDDRQQATLAAIESAIDRELAQAALAPDSYRRSFTLPTSIDGEGYAIQVLENTKPQADALIITWRNTTRLGFLEQDVSGTLSPGANVVYKNGNTIWLNTG